MDSFLLFLLVWLAASRLVGSVFFYELARGRVWPEGEISPGVWCKRAILCPEWTWILFWKSWEKSVPAPLSLYCHPRDRNRTDFS